MLQKPEVPFAPVTVNDIVVDSMDRFVSMAMLDIWELVMLPQIESSTVDPLFIFA